MPKEPKAKKYYVVFKGSEVGVFETWDECQKSVKGYKGASFASFKNRAEAEQALSVGDLAKWKKWRAALEKDRWMHSEAVGDGPCIAVDAACSGFPGPVEYRGVLLPQLSEAFKCGPFKNGSNNIGEFLAIVTAMRWQDERSMNIPIFSDSKCAIAWTTNGNNSCNTTMKREDMDPELLYEIRRAESWLRGPRSGRYLANVKKWNTAEWGEIPADYGRK